MNKTAVRIRVKALYINAKDKYACPNFCNVLDTENKQPTQIALLCGMGIVLDSPLELNAETLLTGSSVVFFAFGEARFRDEIKVSSNCVIPIDSRMDPIASVSAGALLPLIAAAEDTKLTLGDRVLLLVRDGMEEIAKKFYENIGCVVLGGTLKDWNKNGFTNTIPRESNGAGVDAIIMLGVERTERIDMLCQHVSRVIWAKGTGAGYDDMEYMCGESEYPHGYTRRTTRDNLECALTVMQKGLCKVTCAAVCADLAVYMDKEIILYATEERLIEVAPERDMHILPDESRTDLDIFKGKCVGRRSPCLLQITACYDTIPEQAKRRMLIEAEYILDTEITYTEVQDGTELWVLSAHGSDGSVVVIHAIAGFTHETCRYEAHYDGYTLVLDQNGLKVF